jgi:hypothetical protein
MVKCAFRLGGTADLKISAQIQGAGTSQNRKKTGTKPSCNYCRLVRPRPRRKAAFMMLRPHNIVTAIRPRAGHGKYPSSGCRADSEPVVKPTSIAKLRPPRIRKSLSTQNSHGSSRVSTSSTDHPGIDNGHRLRLSSSFHKLLAGLPSHSSTFLPLPTGAKQPRWDRHG